MAVAVTVPFFRPKERHGESVRTRDRDELVLDCDLGGKIRESSEARPFDGTGKLKWQKGPAFFFVSGGRLFAVSIPLQASVNLSQA